MSKKVLFLSLSIIAVLIVFFSFMAKQQEASNSPKPVATLPPTPSPLPVHETTAIFVPSWHYVDDGSLEKYDRLFYFGVTAGTYGVNTSDEGYRNLPAFAKAHPNKDLYLTVRMLDTDSNLAILKNKQAQQTIMDESTELATKYGFKGVILDFELSALSFSNVTDSITAFVQDFSTVVKEQNLRFSITAYGDTFYLRRPFDMKALGAASDEVLVMAYDFHKVHGEPGPNFPFGGADIYGYDFPTMTENFLTFVPKNKLTVLFGMYGYDWLTDEKKRPVTAATAISLKDIKTKFLDKCELKNCVAQRDSVSGEVEVDYVDSTSGEFAIYHTVWFEDETSVAQKRAYLKSQGIGSTGYWIYGYF